MTPFTIRASKPGDIDIAYFVDMVSFGALFYHGERASPRPFDSLGGYLLYAIPAPNRHADLRGLATVQYSTDLCDRVESALVPLGWTFVRFEQTKAAFGRLGGRPPAVDAATFEQIKIELKTESQSTVARRHNLPQATLSNMLRRDRAKQETNHG